MPSCRVKEQRKGLEFIRRNIDIGDSRITAHLQCEANRNGPYKLHEIGSSQAASFLKPLTQGPDCWCSNFKAVDSEESDLCFAKRHPRIPILNLRSRDWRSWNVLRASRPTLIQPHAPRSAPWVQGWFTTDATCRFLTRGGFLYIGWFGYQRAWLMSCAGMRQRLGDRRGERTSGWQP